MSLAQNRYKNQGGDKMSRLICEKCEKELDPKTIVANNVYNCQKCGLVEAIQPEYASTGEINKENGKPKYYLNEEQTVFLILSGDTATVEGSGKIDRDLFGRLRGEIKIYRFKLEIKENIQLPDDCSGIFKYFEKEINIDPNIDTSNIKDMSDMFCYTEFANPDVSNWDVSNVTHMWGMFSDARIANPDVSKWDVSNVRYMYCMFKDAYAADPDVSNWDVSNVRNMASMFYNAVSANPDVSKWNVSPECDRSNMFYESAYTGKSIIPKKDLK